MPASDEEIEAAVRALRKRLTAMATSIGNFPTIPSFLAAAVEQVTRVAVHDAEQQVRKALRPTHVVEPWAMPTPEEIEALKASQPAEDDDGMGDLRKLLRQG